MARLEHSKRESSRARDRAIIDDHLNPKLEKRQIDSGTPADVQAVVHDLASRRKPSTVRRSYSTARAIFNFAVASDLIVRSPCRGIKLPSVGRPRWRVSTADELATLADAMDDCASMAYLGAVLGLRWGEIAGLRVG